MTEYAAAVRIADLRPATPEEEAANSAWREAALANLDGDQGPIPYEMLSVFHLDYVIDGPDHAYDGVGSLCGLKADEITVVRHTFWPEGKRACLACISRLGTAIG